MNLGLTPDSDKFFQKEFRFKLSLEIRIHQKTLKMFSWRVLKYGNCNFTKREMKKNEKMPFWKSPLIFR